MGGPGNQYNAAQATEAQVSAGQLQLAQEQEALSKQNYERSLQLTQPLISKEQNILKSPAAALSAAAPEIAPVASSFNAAKEQIMSNVPAGPARDYALAQLSMQKDTAIGSTIASEVQQAPGVLASVGQGFGGFSLQELGASLSGFSGAGTTSANIANQANQAKANQLGFFGELAGAAGGAVGAVAQSPYTLF
jgi:hypothetical protein